MNAIFLGSLIMPHESDEGSYNLSTSVATFTASLSAPAGMATNFTFTGYKGGRVDIAVTGAPTVIASANGGTATVGTVSFTHGGSTVLIRLGTAGTQTVTVTVTVNGTPVTASVAVNAQ